MNLQRLLHMKPAELAFRCRQQVFLTLDRLTAPDGETNPRCQFDSAAMDDELASIFFLHEAGDGCTAAAPLQQRFRRLAPARFFAGATEAAGDAAADSPGLWQQSVEAADAVCRGEFDILGYGKLSFGTPVDWHSEPISGLHIAPLHWSKINPLSLTQVGDSKVVWELNRHQWLLDLGQAWRHSGDERYAQAAVALLSDWMQANPPGYGINWSSSLEVALRLIAWCWALVLFIDAVAFTPAFFARMLGWMQTHARHIERHLSHYFSPNTHLTGEALGLYYIGTLLPELNGASRWRTLGRQLLEEQMQVQVFADGVYFEQSTSYQYYTVEIYLHFVILAQRNGEDVPAWMLQRLGKMLDFLLAVRRPDRTVPPMGDTDGGWLLPLVRRAPGDHGGLFSTAALLLSEPRLAWAAGALAPESRWLLGAQAEERWEQLQPMAPDACTLQCFREGGYVVMRSGWGSTAHQLIFDTGPLGCHVSGGHGHADLLAIQCSAFGEAYIVDAGTGCYTADQAWRDYFRSSHAHSTVQIDQQSQAQPSGPFSWHARPAAHLRQMTQAANFCVADAEHAAYHGLADPVLHRRRVAFVDERFWIIVDDLDGGAEHRVDLQFQFADLPVSVEADGWTRARGKDSALLLKSWASAPLTRTIRSGQLEPKAGWLSPNYGQRKPAPMLGCTTHARLPLRIVTLLYPVNHPESAPPEARVLQQQHTVTDLIVGSANRERVRITQEKLTLMRRISEWN